MTSTHLTRSIVWFKELLSTLIKFWLKNPSETVAIIKFLYRKILVSPRFVLRNVFTEEYIHTTHNLLQETILLYRKVNNRFTPDKGLSYQLLYPLVSNKMQMLYFLIRKTKPQIVVETGVAAGESTSYILQALHDNKLGELYSIDLPFQWYIYGNHKLHLDSLSPSKKPGYLIPNKLKKNWKLILGDTHKMLPKLLKQLGKIDIFFHDSKHTYQTMIFEYKTAWPYIKKGGILISDDVDYTSAFSKFSKDIKAKTLRFKDLGIIRKI